MHSNKCIRYKTFREELPTKKFLFINEEDSMHRLKIVHEDACNQNKSSEADGKIEQLIKEEPKVKEEPVQEEKEKKEKEEEEESQPIKIIEKTAIMGKFRDEKRRIDLVLVVEDKPRSVDTDTIKTDFLTNIIKTGLQIEVEPGVMGAHKNLLFIKIHAPDHVITEYGEIFGIKRHFVESHLDSTNPILPCMKNKQRDWINLIRKNYSKGTDMYSYYERSLIVYKILLNLPFGNAANHYSINRLLERNIILDAYALHDGPYRFMPDQTVFGSNARQILYYKWSGFTNMFKFQPLHLIHEYFGPQIAFYFAFYGFLNTALAIASIGGVINTALPYFVGEKNLSESLCGLKRLRLGPCRDRHCWDRHHDASCDFGKINILLDHPYTGYYSLFTIFWAFTFITFWKRKEYFLKWMWELNGVDLYCKTFDRPEYKKSLTTGFLNFESQFYKLLRFVFTKGLILVYLWAIPAIMKKGYEDYEKYYATVNKSINKSEKKDDYRILAEFQARYMLMVSLSEMIYHVLSTVIVRFENHRTYKAYEESLAMKEFGFSFILIYSFMGYIAWLVPQFRLTPSRCGSIMWAPMKKVHQQLSRWFRSPWVSDHQCKNYCWPFTCIIELSTLMTLTLLVKVAVFHTINFIMRLRTFFLRSRNDKVPCWEREYTFNTVGEGFLLRRYLYHAFQFSMATLFVVACPLAPLVIFLLNFLELRYTATQLIMYSRRPLLIRKPGIGIWNKIFTFIAYASIVTNVGTLTYTTRLVLRYYMEANQKSSKTILDMMYYYKSPEHSSVDTHSLLMNIAHRLSRITYVYLSGFTTFDNYFPSPTGNELRVYRMGFIFLFVHITGLYSFIIKCLFPPYKREIEEKKDAERRIKTHYYHYKKKMRQNTSEFALF